jgi:exodeoxyribonuclease-3
MWLLCKNYAVTQKKNWLPTPNYGAVILKTDGYLVGLTSSKPISLKEKAKEGLWHGLLHAATWDVDFFVVYLSPADRDFRFKEVGIILDKINTISNENYMVLGDFNAHSPFDGELDLTFPKWLEKKQKSDLKSEFPIDFIIFYLYYLILNS